MRGRVRFAPLILSCFRSGSRRGLRHGLRSALALAALFAPTTARAGGFEIPDNGAQALGRGAAFVAKANDATAIYWNPAGLARQRGTNLLLSGNLYLHSFEFQRGGTYPDDPNVLAYGDQPYPAVTDESGPSFGPFAAATTDFGSLDRLTLGVGVFTPPMVLNRTFPLGLQDRPSPSRYDFVQSQTNYYLPTASLGARVAKWLDVGVSAHLVLANINQTSLSYIDLPAPACAENEKRREDYKCDARTNVIASGTSFAATFGAMARPSPSLAFGATFRTPTNITAQGTFTPDKPEALQSETFDQGAATYALQLPWMLRLGGRYIGMDADFELYDIEVNVSYEGWSSAQGTGPIMTVPEAGSFKDIQVVVQHAYSNTFGLRAGGAYNIDLGTGVLSVRGGGYFDSSATEFQFTRLDHDTLAKVAGTFGVGYRFGAFGLDFGYAAVASIPRTVGTGAGQLRPVNERQGGDTIAQDGSLLPVVNEGAYRGFTHILSFGASVSIEALFGGGPRVVHYGDEEYEPNMARPAWKRPPPGPVPEPAEEKEPVERKPDSAEKPEKSEKKPDEPEARPASSAPASGAPASSAPSKTPPKRSEWWEEPE